MNFANFTLLAYNLAINRFAFTKDLFENSFVFGIVFVAIYVPAAMALGYFHRRRQLVTENEVMIQENWVHAWQYLCFIRVLKGVATKEEVDKVMKYFDDILLRHNKGHLIHNEN